MFRNVTMFRLSSECTSIRATLADALGELPLRPVGQLEYDTAGFVPPIEGGPLVESHGNAGDLIALGIEERVLPAAAVKKVVNEKIRAHEEQTGHKAGRARKREIKEDVLGELLPKALIRPIKILASIDYGRRVIYVDTPSRKRAERVISKLRDALGTLRAYPLTSACGAEQTMTQWLHEQDSMPGQAESGTRLDLGESATLYDPADTVATVTFKGSDLYTADINTFLSNGMLCSRLGLILDTECAAFAMAADLSIRGFKLLDGAMESHYSQTFEDAAAEFRGRYALTHLTLGVLFDVLNERLILREVES